jgi:hypothetical protein
MQETSLKGARVPINIEEIIEKALEQAFLKAIEETLQAKAPRFQRSWKQRSRKDFGTF